MHKKILIADNDSDVCDSLAMLLSGEGYCVDATTDSGEAAMLLKKDRYDVCFFDYKMSGLNGIDILKMTKDVNPRSSVFIITGMLNIDEICSEEINTGLVAGIVSKPFDIETLLQRIAAII
jgi:two-component system response regulator AtoC